MGSQIASLAVWCSVVRGGVFLLLALLVAVPARMAAEPAPGRFPGADIRHPPELAGRALARQALPGHAGPGAFAARQPAWSVGVSPWSGSVSRAFGPGLQLPGAAAGDLPARARAWLSGQPGLLAPGVMDLDEGQLLPGAGGAGDVNWLRFRQRHQDLPVMGASLSLAVKDGHVVFMASRALGLVDAPLRPGLSPLQALNRVREHAGHTGLELFRQAELALAPRVVVSGPVERLTHDLVWRLEVLAAGDALMELHHAWVDARAGKVIAFWPDAVNMSCAADPRQTRGIVRGGVRPNRADDAEVTVPLPAAPVAVDGIQLTTDSGGYFAFTGGTASCNLQGDHFKVSCEDCDMDLPFADDDGTGVIDFGVGGGSAGPGVVGNGTSTPGERSAFYHLEQARQLLAMFATDIVPDLRIQVNIANVCNARSGSYRLEFFQEGSGCFNTAEIRDVIQHELGHSWDRFDGNDITDGGMSEWKGDMMAVLMGGDSCIGESFRISPTAGATAGCSGVRDVDELAPGRQDLPVSATAGCPSCPTLTRSARASVCGSSVHCTGQIPGQAIWHLYQNLLTGKDYGGGNAPLPGQNPALSATQARTLLGRWLIGGGAAMETWDPGAAGVSIYDSIMVADDDDLNLGNGTPHAGYINPAFEHHEIEESPLIADADNCVAPADPGATAVAEIGEGGRPRVRIEWLAEPDTAYHVLRRRFVTDMFLPVVSDVAEGPVLDQGVSAGEDWQYLVQAISSDGCAMPSAGDSLISLSVNVPELAVSLATLEELGGDGDGLVEPGESASVFLSVTETGGLAGVADVSVALQSTDLFISMENGVPVALGNIAAGQSVESAVPFTLRVARDLPCGAAVDVQAVVTTAETCTASQVRLPVALSCDADGGAFVRPVPGSLQWVQDTGDGDGLADNCELSTYSYRLHNAGNAPSGAVTATVTPLDPRSPVLGGGTWSGPGLEPGASVSPFFTVDMSGWNGPDRAGFTIRSAATASPGPVTVDMEIQVEQDPPFYTTHTYDFDDGAQGWSASGFELSPVRSASGTQSFHGGDAATNWLCQSLSSPSFRLDPAGGSAVSMEVYVEIEPFSGGLWWDRANVHLVEEDTGRHVLLTPQSGLAYNAQTSSSLAGQLCHVDLDNGWAGSITPTGFTTATFDLSAWSDRPVHLEVNYSSDGGDDREGIYVDDVVFTGAAAVAADNQADGCAAAVEVSPPGSDVPLMVSLEAPGARLAWEDLGAGFTYNIYSGTVGNFYDHGAVPLACAASAVSCDGITCTWLAPDLPPGMAYYLVTATSGGRQGPSGFTHAGALRDPSADACVP